MKNWRDWDVSLSSYAMETNPIRLLSLSSNGWVAAAFEVDEGDVRKIKPNANCDVNLIELLFNHYRLELFPVCSCSLFLCRLSGIWFNLNFWFDIFQDWGLRGVRKLCHLSLSFTMKILLWKYSQESNLFWFMLNLHESTRWHDFCTFPIPCVSLKNWNRIPCSHRSTKLPFFWWKLHPRSRSLLEFRFAGGGWGKRFDFMSRMNTTISFSAFMHAQQITNEQNEKRKTRAKSGVNFR